MGEAVRTAMHTAPIHAPEESRNMPHDSLSHLPPLSPRDQEYLRGRVLSAQKCGGKLEMDPETLLRLLDQAGNEPYARTAAEARLQSWQETRERLQSARADADNLYALLSELYAACNATDAGAPWKDTPLAERVQSAISARTVCEMCGSSGKDVEWGADPYLDEINNDDSPRALCGDCRQERREDI